MAYATYHQTPLGLALITSDGDNLTGLWFDGSRHCPDVPCEVGKSRKDAGSGQFSVGIENAEPATSRLFADVRDWLDAYFAGKNPSVGGLPIALYGSAFQTAVWNALRDICYGTTVSYGEIAARVGCKSARAVGGAVGRNPVSLIIPCHRVIGADGSLTGYGGGLDRKRKLLELECVEEFVIHVNELVLKGHKNDNPNPK
jgi:methylated-DNA-[protein]-cysteine S-methyltransferase|uniref:Methylated-DNA--protein-cysteine methyltransferase n=1 Tax=uncultured bacterium contig00005 TaxID=1181497 RepID=A0A806K020_9BACT|nr:methylated-DNA--protein-cysteine methyltransferase [uncultured bacterium contig00005]